MPCDPGGELLPCQRRHCPVKVSRDQFDVFERGVNVDVLAQLRALHVDSRRVAALTAGCRERPRPRQAADPRNRQASPEARTSTISWT